MEYKPVLFKAAVFDIETTDFATGGVDAHLICCSILPVDSEDVITYSISFEDKRDDKRIILEIIKELEKYDILIGHYAGRFDSTWLGGRMAYHGIPRSNHRWMLYDTFEASRRINVRSKRKSLAFLCDFFRIDFTKTAVYPVAWSMVDSPIQEEFDKSIAEIVEHCEFDVKATRQLMNALWPLDTTMVGIPVIKRI